MSKTPKPVSLAPVKTLAPEKDPTSPPGEGAGQGAEQGDNPPVEAGKAEPKQPSSAADPVQAPAAAAVNMDQPPVSVPEKAVQEKNETVKSATAKTGVAKAVTANAASAKTMSGKGPVSEPEKPAVQRKSPEVVAAGTASRTTTARAAAATPLTLAKAALGNEPARSAKSKLPAEPAIAATGVPFAAPGPMFDLDPARLMPDLASAMPMPLVDTSGALSGWASQMARATRLMAEMQAALLDHTMAEMKASMATMEECARARTPSEVVAISARSFSRSSLALTEAIRTATGKASAATMPQAEPAPGRTDPKR